MTRKARDYSSLYGKSLHINHKSLHIVTKINIHKFVHVIPVNDVIFK